MTTICWDGKTLVSDSQMTSGNMIHPAAFKKIHVPDDATEYWEANGVKVIAFGLAGQAKAVEFIKEYLRKGVDYKSRVEHSDELDFEVLLITEKHNCFLWSVYANKEKRGEEQFLLPLDPPVATGSGKRFALSILSIGKSSEAALKATMKLDAFTGGEPVIFTPPPIPAVPSVRPEHLKVQQEPAPEKIEGEGKRGGKERAVA